MYYQMTFSQLFLFISVLCVYICGITGYTVEGNKLKDPNGALVTIKGVCRPSFEWNRLGEQASLDDYTLMKNKWGANVVRLSLNQDFWFEGPEYASTIDKQVNWIRQLNMGVILDLHWNQGAQQNMADKNSITFWAAVAAKYKGNPWVMFELYNEPHDISWDQWLNGDSKYAGMQSMFDAVRATGATNTVIVGGINWAYDLSGVLTGYKVKGSNIAYATHPYDFPGKQLADWATGFGAVAAVYPVIMTEFGQYCATNTYVADLLNYAELLGIHWTAWAWYVQGCAFPSVISSWDGTPYPGVGETVKRYMTKSAPSTSGSSNPNTPDSPSATTRPTNAPTNAPSAAGSLTVYADGLQSAFQDWSWSTSYTLSDNQYSRSGSKSIRFEAWKFQGVYIHAVNAFAISAYDKMEFYVNGGTSAKAANVVSVKLYSTSGTVIGNSVNFPVAAAANQWNYASIPVSAFGVSPSTQISGFVLQSNVDASAGNIWVDDIAFVPVGATSAPTKAPTSAPATAAPTKAPTSAPATVAPTKAPTSAPATAAPTKAPTSAPATAAPTKAPTSAPATAAPTKAPTAPATSAPTTKPTSPPVNNGNTKITLHSGASEWWFALSINSADVLSVEIKDSGKVTSFSAMLGNNWGSDTVYAYTTQGSALVAPITARVTSKSGKVVTATISSISPNAVFETSGSL
jgi:hypothetical protein